MPFFQLYSLTSGGYFAEGHATFYRYQSSLIKPHLLIIPRMKFSNITLNRTLATIVMLFCIAGFSFSQGKYNFNVTELLDKLMLNPEYRVEHEVIRDMRLAGISDTKILDHIEEKYAKPRRKAANEKLKAGDVLHPYTKDKNPVPFSSCAPNDIGFEAGTFGSWTGQTGCMYTACSGCSSLGWVNATLPVSNRIKIVPAPTTDPCATVSGFPIPLPSPTGGNFSAKLGNNQVEAQTERISHQFVVTPADTNFLYQYAVVFDDPTHAPSDQPFFDFVITAPNGDTIPCSFQHYTAGGAIPGFQLSSNPAACGGASTTVYYKPWTTVGVNLGNYVGLQVTITCTTGDCGLCGHMGYAYLDFSCGTTTSSQFCVGTNSVVVVAPNEPGATYSWTPGGAATQSITVNPTVIDTVNVFVNPPSGCGYFVNFILIPTVINPAFTYTLGCTTATFTEATTITGGTVSSYSWSFPGGSPWSSTLQTPPTITYPPGGTYTVTLTVVSQAGCVASTQNVTITVPPLPVANAGSNITLCAGNTGVLNGSGTPPGGTYSWSPSTGLSSTTAASPTAGPFTGPATYTLTYTTVNGCKGTDVVSVAMGSEPLADANYVMSLTCEGVSVLFTDSSQNATAWHWDFGDGATSTMQNPPPHVFPYNGVYNVILVVTNAACKDSFNIPILIGDISAFLTVKAPNVFTPNNDGLNDCFEPIIGGSGALELANCITMEIFDRWGIKIFESSGGSVCWDGKTKSNTKAKDGTYYYLMEVGGNTFKGYVELLRHSK